MDRLRVENPQSPRNVVAEHWHCKTESRPVDIIFDWEIANFTQRLETCSQGNVVQSDKFFSEINADTHWYLRLYPKGQLNLKGSDEHSMGLYLHVGRMQEDELVVKFKFSLLDVAGNVTYSQPLIVHSYSLLKRNNCAFGYPSFIKHSQLFSGGDLLPNGTLTIRCQLEYQVESTETW